MLRNSELTERQVEFRNRLHELIAEYGDDIGPALGGHEDGEHMAQPALAAFVLVSEWVDLEGDVDDGAVLWFDSGCRWTQSLGLMVTVTDEIRAGAG